MSAVVDAVIERQSKFERRCKEDGWEWEPIDESVMREKFGDPEVDFMIWRAAKVGLSQQKETAFAYYRVNPLASA